MKIDKHLHSKILSSLYKGNEDYIGVILQIHFALILVVIWIINDFENSLNFVIPILIILFTGKYVRGFIEKRGNIYLLFISLAVVCFLSYHPNFSQFRSFNWVYVLFIVTLIPSVNYNMDNTSKKLFFLFVSIVILNIFIYNLKNIGTINYNFVSQFTASLIKMMTSALILYYFMMYFIDFTVSKNSVYSLLENTITHRKIISLNIKNSYLKEKNKNKELTKIISKVKYSESGILLQKKIKNSFKINNHHYNILYELLIKEICKEIHAQSGVVFVKNISDSIFNIKGGYAISYSNYLDLKYHKEYAKKLFENDEQVVITNSSSNNVIKSHLGSCLARKKVVFLIQTENIKGIFEFHFVDDINASQKAEILEYFRGTQYYISNLLENIFFNEYKKKSKQLLIKLEKKAIY